MSVARSAQPVKPGVASVAFAAAVVVEAVSVAVAVAVAAAEDAVVVAVFAAASVVAAPNFQSFVEVFPDVEVALDLAHCVSALVGLERRYEH